MKYCFSILFLTLFTFVCYTARASHIVGGEMTYIHKEGNTYEVTLSIYEDCLNGDPTAIAEDEPGFFCVFDGYGNRIYIDSVHSVTTVVVPVNFSNSCVTNIPATCLRKKTFVIDYVLPPNPKGYIVVYQRCCRNGTIKNIEDPSTQGATYFCNIPPAGTALYNNSAVFKNYPPQIICVNNPLVYDHSATDPDGDSLSYEFCNTYTGGSDADAKPIPVPPPYALVTYVPGFSSTHPITGTPTIQINPVTGLITGTPNSLGRYVVTVCCNEWRHGVLINTIKREFQFVVTDCSKVVVADIPQYSSDFNTYVVDCSDYTVHFANTSSGGFSYHWDFGVPGLTTDTSSEFEPTYVYSDTGTFTVKLVVNPGTTCPDSISRFVKVYPRFHAQFVDTGTQCPGSQIGFTDLSTSTFKPIVSWLWNFADGDTSQSENPVHTFQHGGLYNVMLISENIRDCLDTVIHQVLIDDFHPFAGNDTIIVKGESIQFNATGGEEYLWSPAHNLNDTTINNPIGYYPDTGRFNYTVFVTSSFGCTGYDTMNVWIVNSASFFVPTAFSPDGNGRNDIFKPLAVGYKGLNYFRIFNRFGELIYNSNSLETGWDGTYKGKKADVGTYYWEMSFKDRFNKESTLKGDVTLLR